MNGAARSRAQFSGGAAANRCEHLAVHIAFRDTVKLVRLTKEQRGPSNGSITPVIWSKAKERAAVVTAVVSLGALE